MSNNFWIQFIIEEAVGAAEAYVSLSGLTSAQKQALEVFIAAGQQVAQEF